MEQSTGRIEKLYQKQSIQDMFERVAFKNREVLPPTELAIIRSRFLDGSGNYTERLSGITALHSFTPDQMRSFVNPQPVVEVTEPVLDKPKVLVKERQPIGPFKM